MPHITWEHQKNLLSPKEVRNVRAHEWNSKSVMLLLWVQHVPYAFDLLPAKNSKIVVNSGKNQTSL